MRWFVLFFIITVHLIWAKTTFVAHPPSAVKAIPTNEGAQISWQFNLPDTVLSFNNGVPYGIWAPHVQQAMGCVFDLSEFSNATLEQIDFLHYSRKKMHGPYYYRLLFFDMDSAKLYYSIDSLVAGDSYEIPRFEIGVPLGSIPGRAHVGVFIEGLSSPDGTVSFPAPMTDSSDYVPGVNYYLVDVNDPFLESDPNYTNFYELKDLANGATNLVLDLWINIGNGNKIVKAQPLFEIRGNNREMESLNVFQGVFPSQNKIEKSNNSSYIDGFYIYRGNSIGGNNWQLIGEVNSGERNFTDGNPLSDSSYYYAVASYKDTLISSRIPTSYYQPPVLNIADVQADYDGDFSPNLLGKIVAVRGTVVSPNFSNNLQLFINDKDGGIQLFSSSLTLDLTVGDSVFVFGKIAQYKGLTELLLDSLDQIQLIGQHTHNEHPITLADVGENYESQLVSLRNLQIVNPEEWPAEGQNSTKVKVTDGQDTIKLFIDKDTDLDGWTPPAGAFNLIAIVDQYTNNVPANDGYELRPRSQDDFEPTTTIGPESKIVDKFDLRPCYPNPFNPQTSIEFWLPKTSNVLIKIFDVRGRLVTTLLNETKDSGLHRIKFNGENLSSGIYLVVFKAGNYIEKQKMVLLK